MSDFQSLNYDNQFLNLASESGADYTQLRNFLAEGKFKEADCETKQIILWVACCEKLGYLGDISQKEMVDRLLLNYNGILLPKT
jgi:hypothetical protein